jgi:4-hydroxy-2-oxoheptanedioate aldolase
MDIPRLNGVVAALEQGKPAFVTFSSCDVESAIAFSTTAYDGVVVEMEHGPYDALAFREYLQHLLNRRQIVESASLAPNVTPLVRIPPNGGELSQWQAKQVLDLGAYGVIWPHVSTVEAAYNAVAACRYPRPVGSARFHPAGIRGDAPFVAARYMGLTPAEYYARADVWPLDPAGEILVVIMIEDVLGIENLSRILDEVPGIGVVLIGEGDLSQELGCPRKYDDPRVVEAIARVLAVCKDKGVPCGHPHVGTDNVEQLLAQGFRFLMTSTVRSYPALDRGREIAGRADSEKSR